MNKREKEVADKYKKEGFKHLHKGWPDFVFYKNNQAIFVEVKRKQKGPTPKMGLSVHQREMINLLKVIGLDVRVEYV